MKNLSFIINSPLEQFEVTSLLSIQIPVLGYTTITLTNLALYSILVLTLIIVLHNISNNDNKLVPSKWSIALESIFSTITSIVRDQIGIINERYLPAKCFRRILNYKKWVQLLKSGDTLKPLIPSYCLKPYSG